MSTQAKDTRALLLAAAWKRLERGDPAHLADVARDAGVSRQALYLHFGSRAGLLIALTQHIDRTLGLHTLLAHLDSIVDPGERLVAALQVTATYAPKVQSVAMALVRLGVGDADARAAFDERMESRRQGIRRVIAVIARDGRLNPEWTVARATDALWAAGSPQTWDLLVTSRGWSTTEFKRWLTFIGQSMMRSEAVPASKRKRAKQPRR